MKAVVQHFIGTTAQWQAANPKLYKAVWGFETAPGGKRYAKLGDGVHRWNDLPYFDTENIKGLPEIIAELNQRIDGFSNAPLAEIEAEARARQAADEELSKRITSLEGQFTDLKGAVNLLRAEFVVYKDSLDYLIQLVESNYGSLGETVPLVTERGDYLVTESDDYLVTV